MTLEEAIKRYTSNAFYEKSDGNLQGYLEFNQLAEWLKDYKRLLEQEPHKDTVSREDANKLLDIISFLMEIIKELQSNKREPKIGNWKRIGYDIYECSICGQNVMTDDICEYRHCHCCGTKMESEK